MRIITTYLSTFAQDSYLRNDAKYYYAIENNIFNLFGTLNNIKLSDIIEENYSLCAYEDGKDYFGVPTGQAYIDEDGDIIDYQLVNADNHPGRLKYCVSKDSILLSSLRLAKSPALNYEIENIGDYVFSNGFYIFNVKKGWNKKFVLYLLRSKRLKSLIDNNIYRGIGISSYKIEDLYKVKIGKCTKENQDVIISSILPIEDKIKTLKNDIKSIQNLIDNVLQLTFQFDYEKFNELKKISFYQTNESIYSNNPDLRFSAKFHRPAGEYVENELRRIGKKRFKHYLAEPIVLGASVKPTDFDENGNTYYISMATIKSFSVELDETQLLATSYSNEHANKKVKQGDIIMNRSGVAIGKVALVTEDFDGIFADFTMRIRLKDYDPLFAYYYMRSTYFQYLIEIYKKGLQNQNIFPIVVQEFPLPDISLEEQRKIVNAIQLEIDKQNEIKNQIAILRGKIDCIIENAILSND